MNFQVVIDELMRVITDILRALPNIINGTLLFFIGYLLARGVRFVIRFVLQRLGFDALIEQIGLSDGLRGLGITARPSRLIAQFVFVLLFLSFAATGARVVGIVAIATLLEQILTYLPNFIGAVIVFLIGSLAAKYIGDLIARVARTNGLTYADSLGRIIQYMIVILVVVLSIGSLGVNTSVLVTVLTLVVAAFALALGLSLGLGARQLVMNILSSYYVRERFPVGRRVRIGDITGEVSGLGAVNIVVETADESLVIPNSTLIRSIVGRTRTLPDTSTPTAAVHDRTPP